VCFPLWSTRDRTRRIHRTNTASAPYPLAFGVDGDPLDVPAEAVAWRVKRAGRRGRPRPVFDCETGRQLELPLTSTIDDLVEAGCPADRYRLEAVDAEGRAIPGVIAYCEVAADDEENTERRNDAGDETSVLAQLVRDTVTANNQALQTLTARRSCWRFSVAQGSSACRWSRTSIAFGLPRRRRWRGSSACREQT